MRPVEASHGLHADVYHFYREGGSKVDRGFKKEYHKSEKESISINSQRTLTRVESLTDYNKWRH